ncbi:proteasome activator complex subunit 4-like isoform X2 [Ptychodera flava]|uniref:proteasome activator complex subunit 4-like isoform X2 n=1 Tax=Ptychodera flava TaxID=63121 RepID=UPI00396A210D
MDDREAELGFVPQKEIPYNKLLPYADKIDEESTRLLADIKANLGRAIQLRELRPGVIHWTSRLSMYIRLYGRKFSKEDHVLLIKLVYELLTIPDLEFKLVQKFAQLLITLLKKKELLSRDDLELAWRPLYQVVERVYYSRFEPLGLEWLPHTIDNVLKTLVKFARVYFPEESTQEMLDEWRPLLCPFDVTMSKGISYLEMFLPTLLPPEDHGMGFKLWLEELLNLWDAAHSTPTWEVTLVELFARVANDNIGYIDWKPYIPKIFTRILRGFNLPVGSKKVQVGRAGNGYDIPTVCIWIVAMMGPDGLIQKHLQQFFRALESYYHPSNMGKFTLKLQKLVHKLPATFVRRVHRERYKKPTWVHPVKEDFLLTNQDITAFVECLKPSVFLAIFCKSGHLEAAAAIQHLAALRPELIIPLLLEKTYVALQSLTEPHQLIATLSCTVSVSKTLLRGGKWLPDGPTHLMPLLQLVLPGIDPNDIGKSMVTFQVVSTFVSLVPVVDCSEAVHLRDDLTDIEREVCSSSAQFEDFILVFMDRCFSLIESSTPDPATRHHIDTSKNQLESVLEIALSSTFSSLLTQSSPQLNQVALDKLYGFVTTHVFDTKVAGKMLADICRVSARVNPDTALKKFIPHCCEVILSHMSAEGVQKEQELDDELLFKLQILSEIVRCPSETILPYGDQLIQVLESTLHLTCKQGYELSGIVLKHLLRAMTFTYPREYRSIAGSFDRPLTEYLPVRDWVKPGDLHNLGIDWHVPTIESRDFAKKLLEIFLHPELEKLKKFIRGETLSRDELLQSLNIVYMCIHGAGAILPWWKGESLNEELFESEVSLSGVNSTVTNLDNDPVLDNAREEIARLLHDLTQYMLTHCEDDTKSLFIVIKLYHALMTYKGVVKEEFDARWKSFNIVKRAMEDKLKDKKHHMRALLIDRALLQHEMRVLERNILPYTELDRILLTDLIQLSTSMYSEVRRHAQSVLFVGLKIYAYCKRDVLPSILCNLKDDPKISHQQFKGALFVLLGIREWSLATLHDFKTVARIWPAIVHAGHSEKLSIMKLMEDLVNKIHRHYETLSIQTQVSDDSIRCAAELWSASNPKPSLPAPSADELERGVLTLEKRNNEQVSCYNQLINTLVDSINSGTLRWKFSQIALGLLTLMIRADLPLPPNAVNQFVSGLVHDSITVRKTAINGVAAILRQHKKKHKTVEVDPFQQVDLPADYPRDEIHMGDRLDNSWHHYDSSNLPKTQEQWDKCVMIDKTHWGYYTWPKPMLTYAPLNEQPNLDRTREEMSEGEAIVYDHFSNPDFVDKLINFLSLEERKGKDKFNTKRFVLFKGLFRNYGDTFLPLFKPHMERLASDSQESSQRCLAELISGIIRGCKHWSFEKLDRLWEFLSPVLRSALNNMTVETVNDFAASISIACESRDPRKLHWLFELLMENQLSGEGGSFADSSRLFVLQGGLAQQEWRVDDILHRLLKCIEPHLSHSYKNVRDRIGSTLVNIFLYDFPVKGCSPTISPQRKEFIEKLVPHLAVLKDIDIVPIDSDNGEKQMAVKLCKTVMKWVTGSLARMFHAVPPELFKLLPVFAPLESCETDDELQQEAQVTLACMAQALLQPDVLPIALKTIREIASGRSWHARYSVLTYLQVMVFYNLFNLTSDEYRAEIRDIVLESLTDDRFEVREMAGTTLSGFLHCGILEMDDNLQRRFEQLCKTKLLKKSARVVQQDIQALIQRHAGVLGLSACIQAYPYDVPQWMPQVLMDLGNHLHDPQPIEMTVKKTLSDFKRTHHDNWQEHKLQFTDDQLVVLTDLLVSPCYYA